MNDKLVMSSSSSLKSMSKKSNTSNTKSDNSKSKKRLRRAKDDNFQRNYVCGCNKSYLSYAALYTHTKAKHNRIFQHGTTTLHKKKQGRPKKHDENYNLNLSILSGNFKNIFEFFFKSEFPNNTIIIEIPQNLKNYKIIELFVQLQDDSMGVCRIRDHE